MNFAFILPFIVGAVFFVYGIKTVIGTKGCQAVSASCTNVIQQNEDFPYGKYLATKVATYEYEFNDQKYSVQISDSVNKRVMKQGRLCMLFIKPETPDQSFVTGPELRFAIMSILMGTFLMIATPFVFR